MNEHEARTIKALKLSAVLRTQIAKTGASIEDIADLPSSAWLTVAQIAGTRVPSDATKAVVLELLRSKAA